MANNTQKKGKNTKTGNSDKNSLKDNIQSVFLFLGILVLCFSIFAMMIKTDVGGFGSTVLAPMIGNVSGLNTILPNKPSSDTTTATDASNSVATTPTPDASNSNNTDASATNTTPTTNTATTTNSAPTTNTTPATNTETTNATSSTQASTQGTATDSTSHDLTLDELATYDGKDGSTAYVAVNGTIYDVTFSSAWINGAHNRLTAGKDLTKELGSSPHGESVLSNLPVVGKIKN